jgi:hypothetical protein
VRISRGPIFETLIFAVAVYKVLLGRGLTFKAQSLPGLFLMNRPQEQEKVRRFMTERREPTGANCHRNANL